MLGENNYLKWLVENGELTTTDGKPVKILDFEYGDEIAVLSDWAKHLRNQYCDDTKIDALRTGTGLNRADYLTQYKFPDRTTRPGPSIRAGDFGESLVADYAEYKLNYNVPRTRYEMKSIKNESTHGTDVIGFKVLDNNDPTQDELLTVEVKCRLRTTDETVLQIAFNESKKDYNVRKAESLNAMKQRLQLRNDTANIEIVERFQDKADRPYKEISGAAVVVSDDNWADTVVTNTDASSHPNTDLLLLAIRGADLMDLTHSIFQRACDES